jgi:hypothetical protein
VLEPLPTARLHPGLRSLAARTGFDLEPELPDPAPAHVDPEGAMHPALLEPLAALPLHAFPTPAARAALAARLLSEAGRPDPEDDDDPFVRVFRMAARDAMEPEVTGAIALVLLRGLMARGSQAHHAPAHPPRAPWEDPDHDPFRRRRPRLAELPWGGLWREISAADAEAGDEPDLEFERETLRASAAWLRAYRAWWDAAADLEDRPLPDDPAARSALRARLRAAWGEVGASVGCPAPGSAVELLGAALSVGAAAEAAFAEDAGGTPRGPVSARWLLDQQIRALRDLRRATRERSLGLHRLVRTTDRARLAAQLGCRLVLLDLWLAPEVEGAALEAALVALPDPPHRTTLGAGLGRCLSAVLLRRLRRGEIDGAEALAARAVDLAPGELSALVAANDLGFAAGRAGTGWSTELLERLRAEQEAWDGPSVRGMGARVARGLGDAPRARWFGRGLVARAREAGDVGWALAASEALLDPASRQDAALLEALVASRPPPGPPSTPDWIALGCDDEAGREEGLEALELALTQAAIDLTEARALVRAPVHGRGAPRSPAWQQLLVRALPREPAAACAALWTRIQDLRAASEELRQPPLAGALRRALDVLADAAPLESLPDPRGAVLLAAIEPVLAGAAPSTEAIAADVEAWMAPLLHALREPRRGALHRELALLDADLRIRGDAAARDTVGALRARVDAAVADPSSLEALHAELAALRRPDEALAADAPAGPGLMTVHPDFDAFSLDDLAIRPEGLRQAYTLVRLFNLAGGQRDRKRLKGTGGMALFELRKRTEHLGGIRVFYRPLAGGWQALAAMSKYDDRQQDQAIQRIVTRFASEPVRPRPRRRRES